MNPANLLEMIEAMLRGQFPSKPGDAYVLARTPEGLVLLSRDSAHVLVSVVAARVTYDVPF